jgi:hypothetical protein
MAVNPVSGSLPFDPLATASSSADSAATAATVSSAATAAAAAQAQKAQQLQQEITALQANNYDDPLLDMLNSKDAAANPASSVADSFGSMLGTGATPSDFTGDPLLDSLGGLSSASAASDPLLNDLNALDSSTAKQANGSTNDEQAFTQLLMQQAAGSYASGQQLGNSQLPGSSATNGAAG